MNSATPPLLTILGLTVEFRTPGGSLVAVDQLDMAIQPGETLVLLGESGSGKSVSALAIMGLLPTAGYISAGNIVFDGDDLTDYSNAAMRSVRGSRIGMVFQEPMTSLNPVMTVGKQITEALPANSRRLAGKAVRAQGIELLAQMGIPEPDRRFDEFPHQLSGGMKQRVMIAIALAGEPDLLIADEPTTALDVTTQAQILELLQRLQQERNMAMLLVTHDFGIAAQMADQVAVMRQGQIVEADNARQFFQSPQHPYSKQLFAALPSLSKRGKALSALTDTADHPNADVPVQQPVIDKPLLQVTGLQVLFKQRRAGLFREREILYAVDGVSLSLSPGETLAIVGESGCGKSTVIKSVLQLLRPDSGSVIFEEVELTGLSQRQLRPLRRHLQVVFQDPYSSLNPRMRVTDIIQEGMIAQKIGGTRSQRERHVDQLLEDVGLDTAARERYPHEFSGGQRQRIGIARALAVEPKALLLDEPTSALDLSVQAQILDFRPAHPYTQALLSAAPTISVTGEKHEPAAQLPGEPPSPMNRPSGCHFHPRCTNAQPRCSVDYPPPMDISPQHRVSCYFPLATETSKIDADR